MNWFKNLKTAQKLILFTCCMLLVMVIIGWQGLSTSHRIDAALNNIYEQNLTGIFRIEETQNKFLEYRIRVLAFLNNTNVTGVEDDLKALSLEMNENLTEYQKTITDDKDRAMTVNLKRLLDEYEAMVRRIIELQKSGQRDLAMQVVTTDGAVINADLRKQINELVEYNKVDAEQAKNQSSAEYNRAFTLLLIIGIVSLLGSLGMGLYVAQLIAKPIGHAVQVIKQMAKGDFTAELEIDTRDEIGVMAQELNQMKDSLTELISNILDTSERVGNGSHEIAVGNQDLSQRTQEQASTLEEVASTIEEINSSIQQTAANSDQADHISQTTLSAVQEGEKAVEQTMEAMMQISVSSQQIADIIKVVNDIAFQTNLLALNAAVEAARAGEQGRGFAVVAAEVRNLAGRTAESSKEIEKLIKESVDRVENGNVLVQRAGEMLKQIVQNTKHTSDVVVEIASAVKEQAGAAGQIQSAIEQLNQVTQQNASMVEEIASSSEALNSESESLSEMVSVFKIKGHGQGVSQKKAKSMGRRELKPGVGLNKDKVQLAQSFKEDDLEEF